MTSALFGGVTLLSSLIGKKITLGEKNFLACMFYFSSKGLRGIVRLNDTNV